MKRGIYLVFIIFLLFSIIGSTVLAATSDSATTLEEHEEDGITNGLSEDISDKAKERTYDLLGKKFTIPKGWRSLYKIIFGGLESSGEVSWEELIVRFILTVLIFIFSLEILEFTAFETKWVKILISGALVVLSSFIGINNAIYEVFHSLINNFWILIGGMFGILVVLFILKIILKKVKNQKNLDKAQESGIKAGAAIKGAKEIAERIEKEIEERP
jgi:hypothetical protein